MTLQSASEHLQLINPAIKILQFDGSSATVEEAANVLGVEAARIAKSLSFKIGDEPILVVTAGDAKIDNAQQFLVQRREDVTELRWRFQAPLEALES